MSAAALKTGLVVASYGRHVLVESPDGCRTICHPRGKKSQAVVGDTVQWLASQDEGTVERVDPRRNLLYRQDEVRTKAFAANLDQVLILIAAEPEFSEAQLCRALIACEAAAITAIIALNKSDLTPAFERAWLRLAPYRRMRYRVMALALRNASAADHAALLSVLTGATTLVLGPSGAGKSTLVNLLAANARQHSAQGRGELVKTQALSQALQAGKHTTTSTTLYWLDERREGALIDSPGFQEFGLHHIAPGDLAALMPDFAAQLGECRFYNCTHLHEPGCQVRAKVAVGGEADEASCPISANRYQIYRQLHAELSQSAHY